jgi:glycosyltransferase involved in cell wall biosynthesis
MSGVEFSTLYLVQHMNRTVWEPWVICPEPGSLPSLCLEAGIAAAFVPLPRYYSTSTTLARRTFFNPFAVAANAAAILASARRLAALFRGDRPDLVVTKGLLAHFYGGLAARWADVPCVWHVQDRVSSRAGPLYAILLAAAGRSLARRIIVDAVTIADQLTPLVPASRISVIWNGVDMDEYSPQIDGSPVRREWGVEDDEVLIGAVGRLTRWKGQHVLIEAFRCIAPAYPKVRVVLVGAALFETADYERDLRQRVAGLGLSDRVIFAGFRSDLPQVLAAVDIFAHPALEKDSSPLAVVSAMASGKPIVCSRVDGTAQLFEEGSDGLLYSPGDAQALAEQLNCLLDDVKLRRSLGQAARAKAERALTVTQFARRCEQVFENVLEDS